MKQIKTHVLNLRKPKTQVPIKYLIQISFLYLFKFYILFYFGVSYFLKSQLLVL
jgi:hypothetical protein